MLHYHPDGHTIASSAQDSSLKLWDVSATMQQTQEQDQGLFDQYDPKLLSAALQFLWKMELDNDTLTFEHSVRTPTLYPLQGHYYADTQFLPLLKHPPQGQTKVDQLIQWLEEQKLSTTQADYLKKWEIPYSAKIHSRAP